MAKQARVPAKKKAPRRPRKRKSASPSFRYLVFTDLHVDNSRLDRALEVLDRVGALAEKHDATPMCLGDFWHLRGHWLVRHVDEVLKRIETWRPSIFIPGNHDQVSLDGRIHGLNIFRTMPQHTVMTDPAYDQEYRVAFLPWRERPADQREQFGAMEGDDWTIFAHAEVGGAIANSGYKSPICAGIGSCVMWMRC